MNSNTKPSRDDREDEYNEARLFVQRGINEHGIEMPTEDGTTDDPEELSAISSIGREQPGNKNDPPSDIADKSPLYGQGFGDNATERKEPAGSETRTGQQAIRRDGPTSISGQGPVRDPSRTEPRQNREGKSRK